MDAHARSHLRESPAVVTVPLILLAIPSLLAGYAIYPLLFGSFFGASIDVAQAHDTLAAMGANYHGALTFALHGLFSLPFLLSMIGVGLAWYFTLYRPQAGERLREQLRAPRAVLEQGYGFDAFNSVVFAGGGRALGRLLWRLGDALLIDGLLVNGAARVVGWTAGRLRLMQTGYLYHYSFAMIIGLLVLLSWFVLR